MSIAEITSRVAANEPNERGAEANEVSSLPYVCHIPLPIAARTITTATISINCSPFRFIDRYQYTLSAHAMRKTLGVPSCHRLQTPSRDKEQILTKMRRKELDAQRKISAVPLCRT